MLKNIDIPRLFHMQTHANASKEARRRIHEYEKRQKSAEASAHEVCIVGWPASVFSFPLRSHAFAMFVQLTDMP